MILEESAIVLRPWTEEDVPALVAACNDAEIARWIPVIPRPYSEQDALRFVRGEWRADPGHQFAVTECDVVREGVLRSHLPHPDGRRRDSVLFSLLPGELN